MGYEFIWKHSNGMAGGDAIKVVVMDHQTSDLVCTQWGPAQDPPYTYYGCLDWTYEFHDYPMITYSSRLWRSLGGTSTLQPSGQTSISASVAAASLGPNVTITGYRHALWTPLMDKSSSIGARSAWIFTVNGTTDYAVDAHTGKVLGFTSD
jgi:hypothetical protein